VTGFDRLHPSLQHHVVNSLGWRELRPLQEEAIAPVLDGLNCLLLAPTAGGKTEAAVLPVLSKIMQEDWRGLAVLYVCPIRALLNNLNDRLTFYTGLVGRSCGLWHGDVAQAVKSRILDEPPDLLLTTPESLEALLVSRRTDRAYFFGHLKAVIVDEIHAFAGDDRGWHLLAVIERIRKLAGVDVQRIGLSATVGNPERLLQWLCGSSERRRTVIAPAAPLAAADAEVTLDYVGSLANAAHVLRVLHHGEKRLVFCDSRSRTEELATHLRAEGVRTFVSHSSLSAEQRRDAEAAFREERDCVIVATSTLELGIDVGDLDRVVQIDAPATVSSFLQRLGRTGRRQGTRRNCLFLATSRDSLLQGAALVDLWRQGFVEPTEPPPAPFHLIAQQTLALVLQEGGIGRRALHEWMDAALTAARIDSATAGAVHEHMLAIGMLSEDSGILGIGPHGERMFGAKNYMALLSIFDSPPVFTVLWGPKDIGCVHPISFRRNNGEPVILSLGGRSWTVKHVDWDHQTAQVVPAEHGGRSRWIGGSQPLRFELCQAVRRVLLGSGPCELWSRRAAAEIDQARHETIAVAGNALVIERDNGRDRTTWWTFAGLLGNAEVANALTHYQPYFDNFAITMSGRPDLQRIALDDVTCAPMPANATARVKFQDCLPANILAAMHAERVADRDAAAFVRRSRMLWRE
jgi:ATP-dependent Lhr-like helicase